MRGVKISKTKLTTALMKKRLKTDALEIQITVEKKQREAY